MCGACSNFLVVGSTMVELLNDDSGAVVKQTWQTKETNICLWVTKREREREREGLKVSWRWAINVKERFRRCLKVAHKNTKKKTIYKKSNTKKTSNNQSYREEYRMNTHKAKLFVATTITTKCQQSGEALSY